MGVFTELKERRLVQILFSYLAAGFVALEVVGHFVERGVLPETIYYVALVWYALGIPAAALVGWHHGEKGEQKAPRSEIAALAVLVVSAVVLSGFTVSRLNAPAVDLTSFGPDPNKLAVLYFEDHSPGRQNQHIAEGLTETLIDQLSSVPALDVVSRRGVDPFRAGGIPRDSVAGVLGVGTLVHGFLQPVGERLQVGLQLYDGASGAPLPDGRVVLDPQSPDSLMVLVEEVSQEASRLLRAKLGDHISVGRAAAETNETAWTLVQRAQRLRRGAIRAGDHGNTEEALATYDEADRLLVAAQEADTAWVRPVVARAEMEFERSRLLASRTRDAARHADQAITLASQALALEPGHAPALDARGTARYWKWTLNVLHDDSEQARLLQDAREDLVQATRRDPSLASAHRTLASLYYSTESIAQGVLAAQRAYDADAYLANADRILWVLYTGNYDLENWNDARTWCDVGRDRFPATSVFVSCPIDLMVAGVIDPDPELAWELVDKTRETAPHSTRDFQTIYTTMSVAGVLARAGMQDSARTVLGRAAGQITHQNNLDDDLTWHHARMRILTDEEDRAIDILAGVIAADPSHAFGDQVGWGWRPLLDHPRFHELQRSGDTHH